MVPHMPKARLLFALALVALGLKAFVPAGYMLEVSDRSLIVVMCSAHGGGPLVFDTQTGEFREADSPRQQPGPDQDRAESPCLFAAGAPLAPPMAAASLPVDGSTSLSGFPPAFAPSPGRGLAAPPPWATGPPVWL